MPRMMDASTGIDDSGKVVIERPSADCVEVLYVPSKDRMNRAGFESHQPEEPRVKLFAVDGNNQSLTVFPINTFPSSSEPRSFLRPKYSKVKAITVAAWRNFDSDVAGIILGSQQNPGIPSLDDSGLDEDEERAMMVLESLPSCFIKDYDYGLGFTKAYRFIVGAVEDLSDCAEIEITATRQTGIDENGRVFYISSKDLEKARKAINRTINNSRIAVQSVNYAATHNFFAETIGQPTVPIRTGRSPMRKSITEAVLRGEASLSEDEQEEVLRVLARNAKTIAASKPKKLATLQRDIELVTLESLIERYQEMMKADLKEKDWQDFLDANSFILSLAFGSPIVKVRGQAWVGGHKLSGTGGTIADFLVKNSLTNNSAIIEIKTPQTDLLNKTPYRREIYTPSGELVGAINQALGQKQSLEREISLIKDKSGLPDIESYAVRCCLIIGKLPVSKGRKRSFELFRGNSKNVDIVTFDELFEKLRSLRDLLRGKVLETTAHSQLIELPF